MENGIPAHLKPYFVITKAPETFNGEFVIIGNIKCSCGAESFTIVREKYEQSPESKTAEKQIQALYEKHKDKRKNGGTLCETGRRDKWCIVYCKKWGKEVVLEDITELNKIAYGGPLIPTYFEAVCSQCGKNILIFDSRKHGYDSMATPAEMNYYINDFKTVKKSKCRKCGSDVSIIILKISSTGKDDLFTESGEIINSNNWENAFDWITVDLECGGCGKKTKKYLDLETM